MLLSWQRKKRLRESLAFRSLERCSSCVLEGVLGVHGGVLGLAADWILLQWRRKVLVEWWMDGVAVDAFVPWSGLVVECSGPLPL
jgi:hypothetical protein